MKIDSDDLIDLGGIADRTGAKRSTVGQWYYRGKIEALRDDLSMGPIFLWSKVSKTLGVDQ